MSDSTKRGERRDNEFKHWERRLKREYFENTNSIFFNFISGQFLDAIIVGVITTVAMLIMKVELQPPQPVSFVQDSV